MHLRSAGINLNPYQGLKHYEKGTHLDIDDYLAGINLNPYQGLKQAKRAGANTNSLAGINLNPYQGLKH